jgi:peptidoglycan/xylan/chitin deacetylase (PgdA/CDA1 family)/GT2 family glycosyltransferase
VNVSIIIPAYNAAKTIGKTLESISAQTISRWEAIVVDDGSSDETPAIVKGFVQQDPRFVLLIQPQGGEGAARNKGIGRARFDWLLFLDADDWIAPAYVERMGDAVAAHPELDAVHCGWIMVDPTGKVFGELWCNDTGDMFSIFASRNCFPVHACIVRRALVEEVGRFDPSLRTCADWDLWQRIARLGARFGRIPDLLAWYCLRPYATWTSSSQFFIDGLRLVTQGHSPDLRVASPYPLHARGFAPERLASDRLYFACFCAGMELARDGDAPGLLKGLVDDRDPDLDPHRVSTEFFNSAPLPGCHSPGKWGWLWPRLEKRIDEFLLALEAHSLAQGLAHRTRTILERKILQFVKTPRPLKIGGTLGVEIELTEPMADIHASFEIERVLCNAKIEGEYLWTLELPAFEGLLHGHVLADAVAAEFTWLIIGRFFGHTIYPNIRRETGDAGVSLWRESVRVADTVSADEVSDQVKLHNRIGWTLFLQEIWGRPDWPQYRFYDPEAKEKTVGCRKVLGNATTIQVEAELTDLEISGESVDVEFTVGGASIAFITFQNDRKRIRAQQLRAALTREMGFELCRAAVREGLISTPFNGPLTLRERLAQAAKMAEQIDERRIVLTPTDANLAPSWARAMKRMFPQGEGGLVLARHAGSASAPSISRRALLPMVSAPELLDAAEATGQPIIRVKGQGSQRIWYAPDLLWKSCQRTAVKTSRLAKARGKLPAAIARILMRGGKVIKGRIQKQVTYRLPILMYHQVAPAGPDYLARYRVTPEVFEGQLRYLHDERFHTIHLGEWWRAMQAHEPIPGRAVILTFDDGYLDFIKYACPLLKRYNFSAIVFLVAEKIGQSNSWDNILGEEVPLLGWKDIHQLQDEGIRFGSHTARHPYLTALSHAEVVSEGARSRAILERELKQPVTAFAYPHGAEDQVVQHLIGACGYLFGLSCRPGSSNFSDPLMSLPRMEVTGSDSIREFISKVNPGQDLLAT